MTLQQIIADTRDTLTPAEIAPVLGVDPQNIRNQMQINPSALGFPAAQVGTRTIIPRLSFLKFMGVDVDRV